MKKGISGDMILQIGIILIAAITTVASADIFYDAVEDAVLGDPTIAAKTLASYTDIVDASNVPITIYHEVPTDFLGNPGYGTVLFNPTECEYTLSKYPQDYMSNMILNNAWDTISIEEALTYYALYKNNKNNRLIKSNRLGVRNMINAARPEGYEATVSEVNKVRKAMIKEKKFAAALKKEGIDINDYKRALVEKKIDNDITKLDNLNSETQIQTKNELDSLSSKQIAEKNKVTQEFLDSPGGKASLLDDGDMVNQFGGDSFDRRWDEASNKWRCKTGKNCVNPSGKASSGGQFASSPTKESIQSLRETIIGPDFEDYMIKQNNIDEAFEQSARTLQESIERVSKESASEVYKLAFSVDSLIDDLDFTKNPNADEAFERLVKEVYGSAIFDPEYLELEKELIKLEDELKEGKLSPEKELKNKNRINKITSEMNEIVENFDINDFDETSRKASKSIMVSEKGIQKLGLFGKIGSKYRGAKATTINYIKKPVTATSAFVNNLNFIKTAKTAAKKQASRIGGAITKGSSKFVSLVGLDAACKAAGAATLGVASAVCEPVNRVIAFAFYSLDYIWTYYPITMFINKAQTATEAVEESLVTISCKSKDQDYYVKVPNCKSETDLYYPDFDSTFLGYVPGLSEGLEGIFAMPASRSTGVTKEYDNIINSDNACIDSHNQLLSKDVIPDALQKPTINPRETVATIPYLACGVALWAFPQNGPGCTTLWSLGYLSSWADTDSSEIMITAISALSIPFAGPIAGPAIGAAYYLNPLDSKSFFPYISKSAGTIDTDSNYYIENPFVISISKKEHNGRLITEINKEL